ncbi:MAG: hypothetical protein GX992_03560 [Clostridium sp.]|nr:hypothetical protein [Clostridium sp.]
MRCFSRERVKLYILLILIAMSFIQVGILRYYQNPGMPTNFLLNVFGHRDNKITYDVGYFFKPYRIVVTEGFENPHWLINEDSGFYDPLWDEAKTYINNLLTKKNISYQGEYAREHWGEVVLKKSFVYEFKTLISTELLTAFLNADSVSDFKTGGIYKMAILPSEDINRNITLYIYNGLTVSKYIMPFEKKGLYINDFDGIINALYEEDGDSYSVIREYISSHVYGYLSPDVLIVAKGERFRDYNSIICNVPESIKKVHGDGGLQKLAQSVLADEESEYLKNIDVYGTIVFQNLNNIYRIYEDGLLEYHYLYVIDNSDRGSESEALQKALEFIKSKEDLMSKDTELYLSGITRNPNHYTFTFDYKYSDNLVLVNDYKVNNRDSKTLDHAITIEVNSKRVIGCHWLLKNFKRGNNKYSLSVKFEDLFDDVFSSYQDLDRGMFSIRDLNIAYEIGYSSKGQVLKPTWSIETMRKTRYIVPMREKPKRGG